MLVCWLVGWLVGLFVGLLVGWFVGWLVGFRFSFSVFCLRAVAARYLPRVSASCFYAYAAFRISVR
jgi:hypothetical protein